MRRVMDTGGGGGGSDSMLASLTASLGTECDQFRVSIEARTQQGRGGASVRGEIGAGTGDSHERGRRCMDASHTCAIEHDRGAMSDRLRVRTRTRARVRTRVGHLRRGFE